MKQKIIDEILEREGGYVNDPNGPVMNNKSQIACWLKDA